jgi:hypothetical protein
MKWLRPYRLAAYVLAIFCAGHTVGGMLAQKPISPAADSVFALMKSTHFIFNGSDGTWYGFWLAFGLTASVFLALSAIVAWQLDGARDWSQVRVIAWALFGAHAVNAVLTWRYFFPGAGTFATLAALLLGVGAWRRSKADSLATK